MESSLTIEFRGAEVELLDRLVATKLFATKSEAVRAALVKYGADLGLLRAPDLWTAIKATPRRRVSLAQLRKDIRKAEDAGKGVLRFERVPVRDRAADIERAPGQPPRGGAIPGGRHGRP